MPYCLELLSRSWPLAMQLLLLCSVEEHSVRQKVGAGGDETCCQPRSWLRLMTMHARRAASRAHKGVLTIGALQ